MPTLPVNNEGAVLYYEDSGAPQGAIDYTTVIALHGFLIHGSVFRPLFPHASSQNLRIVFVNQREYPGSSPLNERELENLSSNDSERQTTSVRDQAIEFAAFLARFIEVENIPAPKCIDGKEVGGISILGWSQGNVLLFGLLAHASALDAHTNNLLERYMRPPIVYDPPSLFLGVLFPPGLQLPLSDPLTFTVWTSAHWNSLPAPENITLEALLNRYDMYESTGDTKYLATLLRLQKEEIESLTSFNLLPRLSAIATFAPEVYSECVRGAFFHTKGRWSHLRVVTLWSDMAAWVVMLASKVMADMLASPPTEGEVRRDVEMIHLTGVNHFYHYENPSEFVRLLAKYI